VSARSRLHARSQLWGVGAIAEAPEATPGPDGKPLQLSARRALITLVAAAILVVGAIALIGHLSDYSRILDIAGEADLSWLAVCAAGEILAYVGYILAYHDLARARGGPRMDYWTVSRVVALGFGATVVGSSAGGLAIDFWALHRAGAPVHEAARRILALNTLEWGVLATAAMTSAALVLAGVGEAPLGMTLGWLIVVPLCVLAAAWVSAPRRGARLSTVPPPVATPRGRGPRGWWRYLARALRVGLADAIGGVVFVRWLLLNARHQLRGLLGYPIYWVGQLMVVYAALRAFDVELGLAPLVLAFTTGYVATALPLPAGGAGGIEASLALTLNAVGVPLESALLAAVTYRVVAFWLPLIPTLVLLPTIRRLDEDLPRTPREEPEPAMVAG
jgi:putative heme transporter